MFIIIEKNFIENCNGPMLCRTLVFSLPEWFAVVKVTHGPSTFRTGCHTENDNRLGTGPILGRYWAKCRLKVGKFKQSKKAAVVGPALDRCKQ